MPNANRSASVVSLALGLALMASLGATQDLSRNPHPPPAKGQPAAEPTPRVPGLASITQSTNPTTIDAGNSISCNIEGIHVDNSYYRAFTLSAFNPPLDQALFQVLSVTIGIEEATAGTGTTQPISVRIYRSTTNPPTNGSLTLLSTKNLNVPDQTQTLLTVPLSTRPVFTVATGILVVEIFTPSGQAAGHTFFIGSNTLGQSGPSFIKAADCGLSEITDLSAVLFPDMHLVMTVNGNTDLIFADGFGG